MVMLMPARDVCSAGLSGGTRRIPEVDRFIPPCLFGCRPPTCRKKRLVGHGPPGSGSSDRPKPPAFRKHDGPPWRRGWSCEAKATAEPWGLWSWSMMGLEIVASGWASGRRRPGC